MSAIKCKAHDVVIRVHTNRAITAAQAQRAAWNALHNFALYGAGDVREPWSTGYLTVRKSAAKRGKEVE